MFSIDQDPYDIAECLAPEHWKGNHLKAAANRSQVGTLLGLANGTADTTAESFAKIPQHFDAT